MDAGSVCPESKSESESKGSKGCHGAPEADRRAYGLLVDFGYIGRAAKHSSSAGDARVLGDS